MKKFFAILAIAGIMTACNDGGSAEPKGDTTATPAPAADTTPAPTTVDTTAKAVDTTAKAADTTAHH